MTVTAPLFAFFKILILMFGLKSVVSKPMIFILRVFICKHAQNEPSVGVLLYAPQ